MASITQPSLKFSELCLDAKLCVAELLPLSCSFFLQNGGAEILAKALAVSSEACHRMLESDKPRFKAEVIEYLNSHGYPGAELASDFASLSLQVKHVIGELESRSENFISSVIKNIPIEVLKRIGLAGQADRTYHDIQVIVLKELTLHGRRELQQNKAWVTKLSQQELNGIFFKALELNDLETVKDLMRNPRILALDKETFKSILFVSLLLGSDDSVLECLKHPCFTAIARASTEADLETYSKVVLFALNRIKSFLLFDDSQSKVFEKVIQEPGFQRISIDLLEHIFSFLPIPKNPSEYLRGHHKLLQAIASHPSFFDLEEVKIALCLGLLSESQENSSLIEDRIADLRFMHLNDRILRLLLNKFSYEGHSAAVLRFLSPPNTPPFSTDECWKIRIFNQNTQLVNLHRSIKTGDLSSIKAILTSEEFSLIPSDLLIRSLFFSLELASDEILLLFLDHPQFKKSLITLRDDPIFSYVNILMIATKRKSAIVLEKLSDNPAFLELDKDTIVTLYETAQEAYEKRSDLYKEFPSLIKAIVNNRNFFADDRLFYSCRPYDLIAKSEDFIYAFAQNPLFLRFVQEHPDHARIMIEVLIRHEGLNQQAIITFLKLLPDVSAIIINQLILYKKTDVLRWLLTQDKFKQTLVEKKQQIFKTLDYDADKDGGRELMEMITAFNKEGVFFTKNEAEEMLHNLSIYNESIVSTYLLDQDGVEFNPVYFIHELQLNLEKGRFEKLKVLLTHPKTVPHILGAETEKLKEFYREISAVDELYEVTLFLQNRFPTLFESIPVTNPISCALS